MARHRLSFDLLGFGFGLASSHVAVSDGKPSATATIGLNVIADGGCRNGQSVMTAAGRQACDWSPSSCGYTVVKRAGIDSGSVSGSTAALDWQGGAEDGIGASANVEGARWNALV